MLNIIWLSMILVSVVVGIFTGHIADVVRAVTESAKFAFELALGLAGVMTLWLGIMAVAREAGLIDRLGVLLKPILTRLFPDIPEHHPAMGAIALNLSANMLGLANAATPFGVQAMKELQRLNQHANVATHSMCMFLAINTSSVQLIPATAIAYLAANGSTEPTSIVLSSLMATICSTIVAIVAVKTLAKMQFFNNPKGPRT